MSEQEIRVIMTSTASAARAAAERAAAQYGERDEVADAVAVALELQIVALWE